MSWRHRLLPVVAVAGFTALVLGAWWAVVMAATSAGLLSVCETPVVRRLSTTAAAALVMGAAVATVLSPSLTPRWRSTFALDRPVANLLGALAAIFVVLRLVTGLGEDRATWAQAAPFVVSRRPSVAAVVRVAWYLGAGGAALVLRDVWAREGLESDVLTVFANLDEGVGYARNLPSDVAVAPLAPCLLLVSGLGITGLALVCLCASSAIGGWLGRRGGRGLLLGAFGICLLPSTWAQPLPVLLVVPLVSGAAALLVVPGARPARAATWAGVLIAAATFSDPSAMLAGPLLAAWILLDTPRKRSTALLVVVPVIIAIVAVLPGFHRLGLDAEAWWWAGGALGDHAGWLVAVDLLMGIALVALHRPDRGSIVRLGSLAVVVVAAQLGRDGSVGWAWAGGLLLAAVLWSKPARDPGQNQSGALSSAARSSSDTSRYHMSAQSLQR